jgi:hypothetical protein
MAAIPRRHFTEHEKALMWERWQQVMSSSTDSVQRNGCSEALRMGLVNPDRS